MSEGQEVLTTSIITQTDQDDNQGIPPPPIPETPLTTEERAANLIQTRKNESERLLSEGKTIKEIIEFFDNDYSILEELYREKVGCDIITDPYEAAEHGITISKSCSIVIPAYNSGAQLAASLAAIQESTFNAQYPQQLEVIVVDDGSPKVDLAEFVSTLDLPDLNIKVFRESNGRENKARYSGVLHAKGDVVILTAHDVVYSPTMIEEYMKRHEVLDNIACFGFRPEVDTRDPRILPDSINNGSLWDIPPEIYEDPRIKKEGMADCEWLKASGHNKPLPIDAESNWYGWTMPSIAWGLTVSAPREALLKSKAAYDPRYKGYGGDDENLIWELVTQGCFVIPNTGGAAYHQRHGSRYNQEEASINQQVFKEHLNSPPRRQDVHHPEMTDAELKLEVINTRTDSQEKKKSYGATPYEKGRTLLKMGLYKKALSLLNNAESENHENFWFNYDKATALTAVGGKKNLEDAITYLQKCTVPGQQPNTWVVSSSAIAYGRMGDYTSCLQYYKRALELDPNNKDAQIILSNEGETQQGTIDRLHNIAKTYLTRGKPLQSLRFYDAGIALAGGPEKAPWSLFDKAIAYNELGHAGEAIEMLYDVLRFLPNNPWVYSRIGTIYAREGNAQEAKRLFHKALEHQLDNSEAIEDLKKLQ